MDTRDMDQLVDVIAGRVRDRLDGAKATPESDDAHKHECGGCQFPDTACGCCGLNPKSQACEIYQPPEGVPTAADIGRYIDHTQLRPTADRDQIESLCKEAKKHHFFSVCVNSGCVHLASSFLAGSDVKVCAVVGFPLGAGTPGSKAYEARVAVRCGATEIDMVLNIGALRSGDYALVIEDIQRVVKAVPGKVVKVILETAMLSDEEKPIACALSKAAGAHFVKTSTGFGPGGATIDDVKLMRRVVGAEMGVKASGGVSDYKTAIAMLRAGASRLGCSSSVAIATGGKGKGGY